MIGQASERGFEAIEYFVGDPSAALSFDVEEHVAQTAARLRRQ
jgi:hypothetical protein